MMMEQEEVDEGGAKVEAIQVSQNEEEEGQWARSSPVGEVICRSSKTGQRG